MKTLKVLPFLLCLFLFSTLTAQKLVDDDIIGNYFAAAHLSRLKRNIIETDTHIIIGKYQKIKRYDKSGELDESFGKNGLLSFGDSILAVRGIFLTEEHLIVIAKLRFDGFQLKLIYLVYDKDGQQLHLSRTNELEELYTLYDILLLKDKKILLIGDLKNRSKGEEDYLAIRLTSLGEIDTTFQLRLPHRGEYNKDIIRVFRAATQRKDGKLLLVESGNYEAHLRLYNLDGTIDTSFGEKGKALIPKMNNPEIRNIHLIEDKILVTGYNRTFFIVRFLENGVLDTTFADKGIAEHNKGVSALNRRHEILNTSIVKPDGKILLLGTSEIIGLNLEYSQALLVRYNENGSLDKTFMDNGTLYLEGFKSSAFLYAISAEKDYKLLFVEAFDEKEQRIGSLYIMELETEVSTSTTEQSNNAIHQLFPNPVSDAFTLTYQLKKMDKVEIELLTMSGQSVKKLLNEPQTTGTHTHKFNLAGLSKGAYYLRLVSGGKQDMIKLMVQ